MNMLLTSAQMRALERDAIDRGTVSGVALMERAGRGVVDAVLAEWPDFGAEGQRALVLCGPGNNGGDGFVIARLLQARGWAVHVWLFGDAGRLPGDARRNHDLWASLGPVKPWDAEAILSGSQPDLIVDAVFGIGLTRPLPGVVAQVLCAERWQQEGAVRRVAVDCPSGLNLDTGTVPQMAGEEAESRADLTVTFHRAKPGHYLG
ncbi:MAG: NAD(P)H-hydrate epimerase, partial [Rhodobacterales bacterium]